MLSLKLGLDDELKNNNNGAAVTAPANRITGFAGDAFLATLCTVIGPLHRFQTRCDAMRVIKQLITFFFPQFSPPLLSFVLAESCFLDSLPALPVQWDFWLLLPSLS